jgi:hypothetical protein
MSEAFGPRAGLDVWRVVADGHRGMLFTVFVCQFICLSGGLLPWHVKLEVV